jgi:hypothetical protein
LEDKEYSKLREEKNLSGAFIITDRITIDFVQETKNAFVEMFRQDMTPSAAWKENRRILLSYKIM